MSTKYDVLCTYEDAPVTIVKPTMRQVTQARSLLYITSIAREGVFYSFSVAGPKRPGGTCSLIQVHRKLYLYFLYFLRVFRAISPLNMSSTTFKSRRSGKVPILETFFTRMRRVLPFMVIWVVAEMFCMKFHNLFRISLVYVSVLLALYMGKGWVAQVVWCGEIQEINDVIFFARSFRL